VARERPTARGVGALEADAAGRQSGEVRCRVSFVAVGRGVVRAHGVEDHHQERGPLGAERRGLRRRERSIRMGCGRSLQGRLERDGRHHSRDGPGVTPQGQRGEERGQAQQRNRAGLTAGHAECQCRGQDDSAAQPSRAPRAIRTEPLERKVERHAQPHVRRQGGEQQRPEEARVEDVHVGNDNEEAVSHEKPRGQGEPDGRPATRRREEKLPYPSSLLSWRPGCAVAALRS
jgi:hypothetical protein